MILIVGTFLGGWALLTLLGAERQRMLREMEASRRHASPTPLFTPTKPPAAKHAANDTTAAASRRAGGQALSKARAVAQAQNAR